MTTIVQLLQIQKKYAKFFNYLLENGIYIAPSQYEAMFVSMAHSDEDIEKDLQGYRKL